MTVNQFCAIMVYNIVRRAADPFAVCMLCHNFLGSDRGICSACKTLLKSLPDTLCRCGLPTSVGERDQLCGRCIKRPPHYSATVCAWQYDFPLDRLLNRYKHQGELAIEPLLTAIWLERIETLTFNHEALLVPIPMHWRRYWKRGFNQTARLATQLSHHTGLPVCQALAQPHQTPMLQGLKASARRRQIRNRFEVICDISQRHLILIDDVMTTGSTANEAARLLMKAGAARVDIWTLCRVLPGHHKP